jgi:hypothetical protein
LKTNVEIDELVTPDVFNLVARYLEFTGANFNAHVDFLGLDPKADFRFADLSEVDFSGSNLRGFDFTGADLRGATGANVHWDKTTILNGADTDDSLFAYRLQHDKFLAGNPAAAKRINILLRDYWPNTILGVEKLLRDKKYPYGTKVAQAVFDETQDITVRSNVLLFMRLAAASGEEHRQFIFNVLARHGREVNVVRAALRALAALYADNRGALNIFKAYVAHDDEIIRDEALNGIVSSVHLVNTLHDIIPHLTANKNGYLRRQMLARIAQVAGAHYIAACWDTDFANALDYSEPLTERKMHSIAQAAILKERYAQIASDPRRSGHDKRLQEALNVKQKVIRKRVVEYRGLLAVCGKTRKLHDCLVP